MSDDVSHDGPSATGPRNSNKYGPTVYQNSKDLGICLEIKDSTFGFLTRAFTFQTIDDLDNFLKKYSWYKNNTKYDIELSLDNYETKTPKLIYKYKDKVLDLNDMLNLEEIIEKNNEQKINEKIKISMLSFI